MSLDPLLRLECMRVAGSGPTTCLPQSKSRDEPVDKSHRELGILSPGADEFTAFLKTYIARWAGHAGVLYYLRCHCQHKRSVPPEQVAIVQQTEVGELVQTRPETHWTVRFTEIALFFL
jgi:hypothetical protein